MSNKPDLYDNDDEPVDRGRRGLLVRLGLVAAAVPVLAMLSPASYARGDDGGDDGGGEGGHDGGSGSDGGHDGGSSSDGGRGDGGDDNGVASRGNDDASGHESGEGGGDLDLDLSNTNGKSDDFFLDLGDDRSKKTGN